MYIYSTVQCEYRKDWLNSFPNIQSKQSCFFSLTTTHEFGLKSFSLAIENRGGVERLGFKNTIFFLSGDTKWLQSHFYSTGQTPLSKTAMVRKWLGHYFVCYMIGTFSKPRQRQQRGRGKKKDLICNTCVFKVFTFLRCLLKNNNLKS